MKKQNKSLEILISIMFTFLNLDAFSVEPSFNCSKANTKLKKAICSNDYSKNVHYYFEKFTNFLKENNYIKESKSIGGRDYLNHFDGYLIDASLRLEGSAASIDLIDDKKIRDLYKNHLTLLISQKNIFIDYSLSEEKKKEMKDFIEILDKGEIPSKTDVLDLPEPFRNAYGNYFGYIHEPSPLYIFRLLKKGDIQEINLEKDQALPSTKLFLLVLAHKLTGQNLTNKFFYNLMKDSNNAKILEEALRVFGNDRTKALRVFGNDRTILKPSYNLFLNKLYSMGEKDQFNLFVNISNLFINMNYVEDFSIEAACKLLAPKYFSDQNYFDFEKELPLRFWSYTRRQNFKAYNKALEASRTIIRNVSTFFKDMEENELEAKKYALSFLNSFLRPPGGYENKFNDNNLLKEYLESKIVKNLTLPNILEEEKLKAIKEEKRPLILSYALRIAVVKGESEPVLEALLKKVDINSPLSSDIWMREPILFSAYDQPELLSYLVKKGADVNAFNIYGENILMFSLRNRYTENIDQLINLGINLKVDKNTGFNVVKQNESIFSLNLPALEVEDKDFLPLVANALYYALEYGNLASFKKLLNAGADIFLNDFGWKENVLEVWKNNSDLYKKLPPSEKKELENIIWDLLGEKILNTHKK